METTRERGKSLKHASSSAIPVSEQDAAALAAADGPFPGLQKRLPKGPSTVAASGMVNLRNTTTTDGTHPGSTMRADDAGSPELVRAGLSVEERHTLDGAGDDGDEEEQMGRSFDAHYLQTLNQHVISQSPEMIRRKE